MIGALAGAVALGGCSGDPAEPVPTGPAVATTAPAPTEPPPTLDADPVTPDDALPDDAESPASSPASPEPTELLPMMPVEENPSTLAPVEKPEPEGGPWEAMDVTLRSGADVIQQEDLPQSFKDFLVSRIGVEDEAGCTVEEVTLQGIHQDGYAYGAEESDCGGMQAVWGIADEQWNYIVAFLDAQPCEEFAHNQIPEGTPGLRCTDEDGTARDY